MRTAGIGRPATSITTSPEYFKQQPRRRASQAPKLARYLLPGRTDAALVAVTYQIRTP